MLKNEVFPTFLQIPSSELPNFWSLDQLVVETLGVASVRSSVRPSVRSFVRPSHFFSETAHYFFMKLYS